MDTNILGTINCIKDWAHNEHYLQLLTNIDHKDIDEMLFCVKPIQIDGNLLIYGCVPCKYFLHKVFHREIEHHLWPGNKLFGEPPNLECNVCGNICNGIFFGDCSINLHSVDIKLHIGCVGLPKIIKPETHPHRLTQLFTPYYACKACGRYTLPYKHNLFIYPSFR